MMDVSIERLKTRISKKKQELDDLEAALRVIENLDDFDEGDKSPVKKISASGVINLSDLDMPVKATKKRSTLNDDVADVVERLGNQEFTVNQVVEVLKGLGKGSDAKHYRNRVAVAIRLLSDKGVIERLNVNAKGNVAFTYRNKGSKLNVLSNS